ncbi:MAG: cytochrome c oxidase subunit 3 [Bacteroidota bacterium]|jgi:cytochrome c oxidase subunit 3|nr:cytochrome c oxidase subunit 3 [Bacteroidota bacterium]
MENTLKNIEDANYIINPKKFVLWLLIVASIMMFAGFTSAYIVRRGEGNWEIFNLPSLFAINTLIIILSSITMQWSVIALKNNKLSQVKTMLGLTLALGLAFCVGQFLAWGQLTADNVFFAFSNPSNSFVYVISGVHLFHVVGGVLFVLIQFIQSLRGKVLASAPLYTGMCATYWHFIGILWIYLYIFLYLYR